MNQLKEKTIALVGNPNIGKTTLFNKLCGLNQRTGNYPGVTVDKKRGQIQGLENNTTLIDLPGINSIFPNSKDEELVVQYLLNLNAEDYPDKIIFLVSALNLKRNLYLFDQIRDLNIPIVLAVNMVDVAEKRGVFVDAKTLEKELKIPVVLIAAKKSIGLENLLETLGQKTQIEKRRPHFIQESQLELLEEYQNETGESNTYISFLELTNKAVLSNKTKSEAFLKLHQIEQRKWKTNASILRYKYIKKVLDQALTIDKSKAVDLTSKLDRYLLHPVFGYILFLAVFFLIFQAIFWLADYPMNWIDDGFAFLANGTAELLPEGYFTRLLTEGIIPGIGGIVIFIPQISILFFLFSLLEESGYMSRVVFLTDRLMQRFGMSGKSIVPMISGLACAIPAIMATRTIENSRERLITILVTPLLTCSARIPVYVVVIGLVIPDDTFLGVFNAQGLALMGLYLLGVLMTFIVAFVLKNILKPTYKSFLLLEMSEYLRPDLKNVLIRVWQNSKSFVLNAGKIIIATAIILFVLATNGGNNFKNAEANISANYTNISLDEKKRLVSAYKMENSYLGTLGKTIEPVIEPLGYDWKIGVALISSLAAREVFVSTISIIYAIDSEEEMDIRDRLQKETKSIKWTIIQFGYMTLLAYFAALLAYQFLK